MAIYKPYIKKSNDTIDELSLYATAAGEVVNLGYYDTITENSDGTYTITRQTGYHNISIDLIKNGTHRPTQAGHGEYGADTGIHNLPIISGSKNFINNLLPVRDTGEIYSGSIGIAITKEGGCWINLGDDYTTTEQYREYFAKNNIYIQYKLATATTEKVEKNHYARYNERFILEHNKSEAERSANLLNIDDVGSKTINGITYSIKDGVITLNGTATDNVLFKAFCNIKANQSYYLKLFDSPIKLRCYYSNDVNTPFGTLVMHAKEKLFTPTTDAKCLNIWIWKDDTINSNIKPMLVEGSTSPITYQPYNQNKHITNNEAVFLKTESDRSANVFDINTVTIGNGYDYTATASDWVKAIDIPVEPKTTYTASSIIGKYAFNHGDIVSDYNNNTITTSGNTKTLSIFIYVGDYSGTARAWFSNYMFNKGPVALPYQPYEGKVIHEKDLKNASTNLGYYDTITENSDGTYTITKQTGYLTINAEDITRGSNETVNEAHAYIYAYSSKKVSDAIYDWDAIIGISNNGFKVNCVDSSWVGANKISINSRANQICIGFSSQKTQADIQALCPIYIQYKLARATTEKVEKNYCAQYNKRFILEHNKTEAERSSNLWSYEQSITINAGNEKWWYLSNETMSNWGLVVGETYSIKSFVNNDTKDLAFQLLPSYSDFKDGRTFVFTSDTQIRIGGNTVSSTVTFTPKIMLVKGIDIADEYQPYVGRIIHKKDLENLPKLYNHFLTISFTADKITYKGRVNILSTVSNKITSNATFAIVCRAAKNIFETNSDNNYYWSMPAEGVPSGSSYEHTDTKNYIIFRLFVNYDYKPSGYKIYYFYCMNQSDTVNNFKVPNSYSSTDLSFSDTVTTIYGER